MKYQPLHYAAIAMVALLGSGAFAQAQTSGSSPSQMPSQTPSRGSTQMQSSGSSSMQTQSSGKAAAADKNFANKAAAAGLAEVAEAQLALQKSSSQDVKNFAQRMVDDHSKANDQLKSIASQEGLNLPTSPAKSDQQKAQALQKLSGGAFDRRYISDQVSAHKEAVSLFTTESKNGKDSALKNFAAQTLPTLQDHYKMVQSIASHPSRTPQTSSMPAR